MTLEEILELDAKRTQGEWECRGCHQSDRQIFAPNGAVAGISHKPIRNYNEKIANRDFIAAAPAMVELLKEQDAKIKELEKMERVFHDSKKMYSTWPDPRVARYEEALKFYAEMSNHHPDSLNNQVSEIEKDYGEIAREALKEKSPTSS